MFDETVVMNDEGALVIPAAIREELNLQPGTHFRLETDANGIHFTKKAFALGETNGHGVAASELTPPVEERNGLLIITAIPLEPIEDAIEKMREERMQHIWGSPSK